MFRFMGRPHSLYGLMQAQKVGDKKESQLIELIDGVVEINDLLITYHQWTSAIAIGINTPEDLENHFVWLSELNDRLVVKHHVIYPIQHKDHIQMLVTSYGIGNRWQWELSMGYSQRFSILTALNNKRERP